MAIRCPSHQRANQGQEGANFFKLWCPAPKDEFLGITILQGGPARNLRLPGWTSSYRQGSEKGCGSLYISKSGDLLGCTPHSSPILLIFEIWVCLKMGYTPTMYDHRIIGIMMIHKWMGSNKPIWTVIWTSRKLQNLSRSWPCVDSTIRPVLVDLNAWCHSIVTIRHRNYRWMVRLLLMMMMRMRRRMRRRRTTTTILIHTHICCMHILHIRCCFCYGCCGCCGCCCCCRCCCCCWVVVVVVVVAVVVLNTFLPFLVCWESPTIISAGEWMYCLGVCSLSRSCTILALWGQCWGHANKSSFGWGNPHFRYLIADFLRFFICQFSFFWDYINSILFPVKPF